MHRRVLVLGESMRATLAIVRSLGRQGINVDLATPVHTTPVGYSRYVERVFKVPTPARDRAAWAESIRAIVQRTSYDLVIPSTEGVVVPLIATRSIIEPHAKCALPETAIFEQAADKELTLVVSRSLGIPLPDTVCVKTESELDTALQSASVPVVVKPSRSRIWSADGAYGLTVSVAQSLKEAREAALDIIPITPVLLQEFIDGFGVGQEFLVSHGDIIFGFEHHRLREYDGSGGSTYRVSRPLSDDMLQASRALLKKLQWHGVVQIEYRRNPKTNHFVLIEINGRFWGSLPLAVNAGADFPYGLYQLYAGESIKHPTIRVGIFGRDLLPDIKLMLRGGLSPLELAGGVGRLICGLEYWDSFSAKDPLPGVVELYQFASKSLRSLASVLVSRMRTRFIKKVLLAPAGDKVKSAQNFLFVCYGNINRSPFAEALLTHALSSQHSRIRTWSRGTHAVSGRACPQATIAEARVHGVSLDAHRAQRLTKEDIDSADLIFVMDDRDLQYLAKVFPGSKNKPYMLGAMDGSGTIQDPDGKSRSTLKASYEQIARAVSVLAKNMA